MNVLTTALDTPTQPTPAGQPQVAGGTSGGGVGGCGCRANVSPRTHTCLGTRVLVRLCLRAPLSPPTNALSL